MMSESKSESSEEWRQHVWVMTFVCGAETGSVIYVAWGGQKRKKKEKENNRGWKGVCLLWFVIAWIAYPFIPLFLVCSMITV